VSLPAPLGKGKSNKGGGSGGKGAKVLPRDRG